MIPETGQRLGAYEVLGRLGGGGTATVLRAWDGRLQREVAIKLIDSGRAMPGIRELFLREAQVVSGLNHANICTLIDIGEQDGELYLVMELLEGLTLRERLAAGVVPVEETLRYAKEIAEALTVAHSRGVVHQDIKPANIFLAKTGNGRLQVKLLGFGLAKWNLGGLGAGLDLAREGVTVSYMSPEQARGEALDARTDLYSLGVTLYEMAAGELPFEGATGVPTFAQLPGPKGSGPERSWNVAIPELLTRGIQRLLEEEPEDRFQSAEELIRALEEIETGTAGGLHGERLAPSAPAAVIPRDPPARPMYPLRRATAAKVKTVWEDEREWAQRERGRPGITAPSPAAGPTLPRTASTAETRAMPWIEDEEDATESEGIALAASLGRSRMGVAWWGLVVAAVIAGIVGIVVGVILGKKF